MVPRIIKAKIKPICYDMLRVQPGGELSLNRGSNLSVKIILNEKKFLRRLKRPMESLILRSKVLSMNRIL